MVEPEGTIVLRDRKETTEFLNGLERRTRYESDIKRFWGSEEAAVSLSNLRLPCAIELEYTYKCNLRCKYCYAYSSPAREEVMPFEEFKRIIDLIDASDIFDVYVLGGEPSVLPDYLNYLLFNLHNKFIIIVSNCTLNSEKICKWVTDCQNHVEFCVDIDGHDEEIHNLTRGKFKETLRGLELLRKYRIPIRVNTCVTPFNHDRLEEIVKFLLPFNIISLKFSPIGIEHLPREVASELDISEDYPSIVRKLYALRERYEETIDLGIAFDIEMDLPPQKKKRDGVTVYGPCTAGITKAGINVNSEMVPCLSVAPKIHIPIKDSLGSSFEALKKEISKLGREVVESDGKFRIQNFCQVVGYGHRKPMFEVIE